MYPVYGLMLKKQKTIMGCAILIGIVQLYLLLLLFNRTMHRNNVNDAEAPNVKPYVVKSYTCVKNTCVVRKVLFTEKENPELDGSINVCRLVCGKYGPLWPKPTKKTNIGKSIHEFGIDNVKFDTSLIADQLSKEYLAEVSQVFTDSLKRLCVPNCVSYSTPLIVSINTSTPFDYLKLTTDESYNLRTTTEGDQITVEIEAYTVYGARNGLETLRQLVASYGSKAAGRTLVVASDVRISDRPAYAYRGFMLDTARHYFSVSTIKRHIDAMGHSKLNVFHWHATDLHSFPLDLPGAPEISKYGRYSAEEKYSYDDIKELLRYALVRGIRIVMEIDSPIHIANSWQWSKEAGYGDKAVCLDQKYWKSLGIRPPFGQLNPINLNTYKWLGKIYKDLISIFPKDEAFHMGGNKVYLSGWSSIPEIVDWMNINNRSLDNDGYTGLWAYFNFNSLNEYDKQAGNANSDIIVWSSDLTKPTTIEKYLDKKRYTIEVWENRKVPAQLVKLGYKVIIAIKDFYYLNHGFSSSSVYHGWKTIYRYKLPKVYNTTLLLGAETCMWSDFVDENGVDSRVWPRAAALAERLWTNPTKNYLVDEYRFLQHRNRLVELGIKADTIMPEWCYDHEHGCRLG